MADRRMFTKKVSDSDAFIEMSSAAQALYFHLNQGADDDGFNNQVQMAMWKAHASIDDLKVLLAKNYIIRFESGVIVIKHWRMHNTLRKDRYTPTNFQEELSLLGIKENGSYTLGCQEVANRLPQDSIGKDSVVEVSIVEDSKEEKINKKEKKPRAKKEFVPPTYEEVLEYAKSRGREDLARKFFDYFDAGDWIDSKGNKVQSWKQKFIVWESSNKKSKDSSLQQTDTEEVNELFNVFWEAYPYKSNIIGAKESFKRIANLQTEFPLIMEALERFKKCKQWTKQNGEFIPLPTSWLDQQRWKDEHIETREDKLKRLDMSDWL